MSVNCSLHKLDEKRPNTYDKPLAPFTCADNQKLLIACMACDWQAVSEVLLVKLSGLAKYCYAF
jgi:hypothetical protein